MSNNNRSSILHGLLKCDLDLLLGVFVQGGGSLIEKQDLWLSENGSSNSNSLFLSTRELAAFDAALCLESLMHINVKKRSFSLVDISLNKLELICVIFLLLQFFKDFDLLFKLCFTNEVDKSILVILHFAFENFSFFLLNIEIVTVDGVFVLDEL